MYHSLFPFSTELAGFIKKVRNKSKNSFSGLSIEEIVERVTEHILDEQKKKKVRCSSSCLFVKCKNKKHQTKLQCREQLTGDGGHTQ